MAYAEIGGPGELRPPWPSG